MKKFLYYIQKDASIQNAGSKYAALGLENKSPAVLPEETALKAARACFSKRGIKVG